MTDLVTALKNRLRYEPETGRFYWIEGRLTGKRAGHFNGRYVVIVVDYERYYAHRLAWLFVYGKWPQDQIDHIDHNGYNNRITNLRDVATWENAMNRKNFLSGNATDVRGVTITACGRFKLQVKHRHIGHYKTLEEAAAASELHHNE